MNKNIFNMKAREYGINPLPKNPIPTMAYIPYQVNNDKMEVYTPEEAIYEGTMFPELNKPFLECDPNSGGMEDE